MEIRVSGHKVEIGNAFKDLATTRVQDMTDKHFARAVSANVTLEPGPHDHGFNCDILIPVNGLMLKGSGRGGEARLAFDQAADKIEKQLRRYSRRLKDRHGPGRADGAAARADSLDFDAGYTVFQAPVEEEPADAPMTIAETKVDVPEASVSDAVMMLDLRNTNALLFRNSGTGIYNMVYRRGDGTIGWVEPARGER